MIEYCIDKDGVISGASKEDLEILKDRMLAKIKDDINLMCSITFALGKEETPAVNVAVPWHMTPWGGDDMRPHLVTPEYPPMDSPAEYRRKMNTPWPDPRANMAFFNRDRNDMLRGLQELLSEPGIAFMPFPADAEELEFDDIERELVEPTKDMLDEMYTNGMKSYTIPPKGWGDLRSDCSGADFISIPIGSTSCRLK